MFTLFWFGMDGSEQEREFEGSLQDLKAEVLSLEERGCWGFCATDADDCEVDVW